MLWISEIFYSIQGEGKFIGTPSVFLRVGGCNFQCQGFGVKATKSGMNFLGCDSIYAANQAFKSEWKPYEDSQKLISEIQALQVDSKFDLILTGGEPSLYFKNQTLLETIYYFLSHHHRVCVESNGSILFDFNSILSQLYFTLSIKLSNAKQKKSISIPAIQNILNHARDVSFKFVLNAEMCKNENAQKEIYSILSQISGSYEVYIMPQGTTPQELDQNIQEILPLCLKYGYNLSDRLHIRIWGDKKGV